MGILLWILVILCVIIFTILTLKITIYFEYLSNQLKLNVKILGYKIDILRIINKKNLKKVDNDIQKNVHKEAEKEINKEVVEEADNSEDNLDKKQEVKKKEIEDYLAILEMSLEVLDEITKSLTFNEISVDFLYGTSDAAKTAQTIGTLWATYGNVTAFLYANFKIKKYNINIKPLWNSSETNVDVNAIITVNTRIIRILKHTKFKNIMEIKKRMM